jgi:xanthine dehydrogenase YagS FAD-binding subunit
MKQIAKSKVEGANYDVKGYPWEKILKDISDEPTSLGHYDAKTLDEASHLLQVHKYQKAKVIGGGTDILRLRRHKYLSELPEVLINIKTIPDLAYIEEEAGILKIGALTSLNDLETSELIKTRYGILAETASVVGSNQIRNMATIAGSLCQDISCLYYRMGKDYYHCRRKGGDDCPAKEGDNRWMFSIFKAPAGCECYATCQSDIAITLSALGASIKTTQRIIPIEQFYTPTSPGHILNSDEVIMEIQIPALHPRAKAKYTKFSIRKCIDRPLVSVACVTNGIETKVVFGGVAITPYIADNVIELLNGKEIDRDLIEKAGLVAVENAIPMSMNAWKVVVMRALIKRTLFSIAGLTPFDRYRTIC